MKLVFAPQAQKELAEAISYYNTQKRGLGSRFNRELQIAARTLLHFWKHQIRYDSIRLKSVTDFPYFLHYSVNEPNNTVTVERVLHSAQDSPLNHPTPTSP